MRRNIQVRVAGFDASGAWQYENESNRQRNDEIIDARVIGTRVEDANAPR
jgi:hypothetical protein